MLTAKAAEERLEAARSLIALGQEDDSIRVVLAVSQEHRTLLDKSADVLSWLPWDKRIGVYEKLVELQPTTAQRVALITGLTHDGDKQAIPHLWKVAAGEPVSGELANSLINALGGALAGQQWRHRPQPLDDKAKSAAIEALTDKLAAGSELQRLVALAVLFGIDTSSSAEQAARLFDDPATPNALRLDAFHIRMASLPDDERSSHGARSRERSWGRSLRGRRVGDAATLGVVVCRRRGCAGTVYHCPPQSVHAGRRRTEQRGANSCRGQRRRHGSDSDVAASRRPGLRDRRRRREGSCRDPAGRRGHSPPIGTVR